jgi:hypothetical protein
MGVIDKFLRVMFLGDGTQLKQTYNDLNKEGQKFSKEVEKHGLNLQAVGKTMVAVGATIVGAFAATVVAVANTAGKINDLSNAAGVSAESFQELAFAAQQEGVSQEQLSAGLVKLTKNMDSARSGSGDAAKAFKAMGINIEDNNGQLRSADSVMKEVADRFKQMQNPAEKTTLALTLFGKAGASLTPFLSQGSAGMKAYAEEAKSMGIILSNETVKALDDFDDTLGNVKAGFGGLGNEIAADIVPALQTFANMLKSGLQILNSIPAPVKQLAVQAIALSGGLLLVNGGIMLIIAKIPAIIAGLTAMNASFAPFLVGNAIAVGLVAISGIFLKIRDNARLARLEIDKITELPEAKKAEAYWEGQVKGLERLKKAAEDAERANKAAAGSLGGGVVSMGFTPEQQARLDEALKKLTEAHNKVAELTKKEQENSQDAINQRQLQLEKEKEILKERQNNEKEWADKVFEINHNALENLQHEEENALNQANLTEKAKADIKAYYAQKRIELAKNEADKQQQILESANEKYESTVESNLNDIIRDEKKSQTQRETAANTYYRIQQNRLAATYKKQVADAKNNTKALEAIENTYRLQSVKLEKDHQEELNQIREAGNQAQRDSIATTITDIAVALGNGEETIKDAMKDLVCAELDIFENTLKAEVVAGVAKAWAQAGGNPYIALPLSIAINAEGLLGIAALEAGKAAIRGLAEGGLTNGPSLNWIGEGKYREAVIPLSDDVLSKIGNSIVNATTNNSNSSSVSSTDNSKQIIIYSPQKGYNGYSTSELKKLWRDLEPVMKSENKRKGLK